ncbi:hypothetical protein KY358_03190 [Candidatus Woesearchaeota archaeon]|nr:hypothetical protein [Candidatus Woesearchaeota archaeon]
MPAIKKIPAPRMPANPIICCTNDILMGNPNIPPNNIIVNEISTTFHIIAVDVRKNPSSNVLTSWIMSREYAGIPYHQYSQQDSDDNILISQKFHDKL